MENTTSTLSRGIRAKLFSPSSKLSDLFSEAELEVAALLVQLSQAGVSEMEMDIVCGAAAALRVVYTCPPIGDGMEAAEDDTDDEVGSARRRRRRPRYRRIADLYAATSPIKDGGEV